MQNDGIFVVCDVETADEVNSFICSIGLAMVINGQVQKTTYSLINPNCDFCERNTKIHGITKDMVADAPTFSDFWSEVGIVFEKAIIVAHNAPFDLSVIKKELIRNNITLDNIRYIDTLQIARKCLTLEHYCLNDVCKALDVNLENHHCALDDCVATAEVLIKLLNEYDIDLESFVKKYDINKVENKRKNKLEIRIGVTLPSICLEANFFSRCPNNINLQNITVCLSGDFESMSKSEFANLLEHKGAIVKKGVTKSIKYLIVGGQGSDRWAHGNYGAKIEKALDFNSKGSNILIVREQEFLIFSNMLDEHSIESISENISYITPENDYPKFESVNEECDTTIEIFDEIKEITEDYSKDIKYLDIDINPINDRVPLIEIRNLNNEDKGYDDGYMYWKKGEEIRKSGDIQTAIRLFDKSRYNGYCAPVLFESYAIIYRKLKDYDNEIDILTEGIRRLDKACTSRSKLEARRDKAVQLLYKQQKEKKKEIENKEQPQSFENVICNVPKIKKSNGRAVLQLSDDMVIIKKYETIADAVRETGINSKSIRETAKGIQKHAGGFVWRYEDEIC